MTNNAQLFAEVLKKFPEFLSIINKAGYYQPTHRLKKNWRYEGNEGEVYKKGCLVHISPYQPGEKIRRVFFLNNSYELISYHGALAIFDFDHITKWFNRIR
jgi:hypothetical protein